VFPDLPRKLMNKDIPYNDALPLCMKKKGKNLVERHELIFGW